jgi:hypothetical protein
MGGKGGRLHFVGGILEMPTRPKAEKKRHFTTKGTKDTEEEQAN